MGSFLSPARSWEIVNFTIEVAVHPDSKVTIIEKISADFGLESKHGIYRDIPLHYVDRLGQHFKMRLSVHDVTDQNLKPWRYSLESAGRYLRVRIGDPDIDVTGKQTYRIVYEVERGGVRFFPDHEEFYWNLTGNEWAVPLKRVQARIQLPAAIVSGVNAVAYVGSYGSGEELQEVQVLGNEIRLQPLKIFGPYEGLTAAVSWPGGFVHPPSRFKKIKWWLEDNWLYGVPFVVFLLMFGIWNAKGRDFQTGDSLVVQYEPPDGLRPAEMGTLLDQRADIRDITSTVIDLAVRGYLKIESLRSASFLGLAGQADYQLTNLKNWRGDKNLRAYERDILEGIFGKPLAETKLSDLEQVFYERLSSIREDIYESLINAGFLDSNPDSVRKSYFFGGILLGGAIFFGALLFLPLYHISFAVPAISSILSALVVILFGRVMPRRTLKGARLTYKILGFLEFLKRTDQDRIRRINDPGLFERGLPYALAFGVAEPWARAFEGLYTQAPAWYAGIGDFSAWQFGRDLNYAASSMGRSFTSQPRSSGGSASSWGGSGFGGGGFSGGGGGGGGGGSW